MSNVFVQKFNALNGTSEWEVQDKNYDFHQEIARSSFADMLHDVDRNKKYYAALKRAIESKHAKGERANVLDIGTGTGLLSMMASTAGADSVLACEAFPPIADIARKIIDANGFSSQIRVVGKRSTDLVVGEDFQNRANILVAEVFDTELIGEGAISTFNHAKANLLEPDAIVVPWLGRVYACVVSSPWLRSHNSIECGGHLLPESVLNCPGSPSLHDMQASMLPQDSLTLLSDPVIVFEFNFEKGEIPKREDTITKLISKADGTAHGVIMWWDLLMDHNDESVISCAPEWLSDGNEAWRDHWMQAVYHFDKPLHVKEGQTFYLSSSHDEYSLWFNVSCDETAAVQEASGCSCGLHAVWPRSRLAAVNDVEYWDSHLNRLRAMLQKVPASDAILFLGDCTLLPLVAASMTDAMIYTVEPSGTAFRVMKSIIRHNRLQNRVVLLPTYDPALIKHEIACIYGEPYFRCCLYPWESLRFWSLAREMMPKQTSVPESCPDSVSIAAVAMHFDKLHNICRPLGFVEGFDLTPFDDLIKDSSDVCDSNMDVQPLWEYSGVAVGPHRVLASLDLTQPVPQGSMSFQKSLPIKDGAECNGIAVWCDWYYKGKLVSTSGPLEPVMADSPVIWCPSTKQGIYIPPNDLQCPSVEVSMSIHPSTGSVTMSFT